MKRHGFILASIILLGILLRLFILSQRGSFEFDEAFSAYFSAMELNGLWENLKFENNPPGYFVLLHFWMQWFGNTDLAVRSLSMVFGIASIPLIYIVGVKLAGKEAGLFSAFLLAISTLPVFYSTEARMYALYLFLALFTVWLYLLLEERREKKLPTHWLRIAFFLVCSLLVWTHITSGMILLALTVYILWKSRWNVKHCLVAHRKFFIILILLAVQLSPWLVTFISEKFVSSIAGGYLFYIPPDRNYFISILETFLVFGQQNAVIVTLISIVSAGLLWMAWKRPWSRATWFLTSWLFVPLLIGFMFSNAVPRYFISVAPAWYLLLGVGFARWRNQELGIMNNELNRRIGKVRSIIPNSLFIILTGALILTAYPPLMSQVTRQWDDLAGWVERIENEKCKIENDCVILVHPHSEVLPFERYWRGKLPVVGFYPEADADSKNLRIVKTNWKNLVTKENVRALADVVSGFNQVMLILGETDRTDAPELVKQWFWENGWKRAGGKVFGPLEVVTLEH